MTFDKIITFGEMTFGEMTFGEMTFGEMTFGEITFDKMTFDKMTFGTTFSFFVAGDLLRDERNSPGSEYGELIENHITNGTIVPVAITWCQYYKT